MKLHEFLTIADEARRRKPPIDFTGIPIRSNSLVPLKRRNVETGQYERVLFFMIDDEVHVHPDRWDEFVLWLSQSDIADHPDVRAIFENEDGSGDE